jgi:hypothetical protein
MNRNQTIAVIVALVVSLSLSAAAWWLAFAAGPTVSGGMAAAVGTLTSWYGFAVAYNALRREVWL